MLHSTNSNVNIVQLATRIIATGLADAQAREFVVARLDPRYLPTPLHQKVFFALQYASDSQEIVEK